jgi:threonine dehydrogenase-like Zn-dependent dehydrogenase
MKDHWPPRIEDEPVRFVSSDIWTSDEDIRVILNLIRYGALDIKPLITHRFSVSQIPEAYDMVWRKEESLIGGVICWN